MADDLIQHLRPTMTRDDVRRMLGAPSVIYKPGDDSYVQSKIIQRPTDTYWIYSAGDYTELIVIDYDKSGHISSDYRDAYST